MDPRLTIGQSLLGSLAIALLLVVLHLAAPRIRSLPFVPERATGSFAGGLAVAYVFLHLLPELAAGNEAIGKALSDVLEPTPLIDLGIFLVALAGFTAFYGLERLAERQTMRAGGGHRNGRESEPSAGIYRLHLASFMVYNGLITYTMAPRLRTGVLFAALFTVAMGLHFVLTDRGLAERYPRQFSTRGRVLLAVALVLGWALSAALAPTSALLVAMLTALLAGSILLNVFKEEIPSDRRSSFGWFGTGLAVYSALLALVTAVGE
jgi:hypothetical protein